MKRDILIILGATLITALIVGYGVYVWNQPIKEHPKSPVQIFNVEANN